MPTSSRRPAGCWSVDLRDVSFAQGGAPFFGPYRTSGPHTLPARLFFECPIGEIVLPERTSWCDTLYPCRAQLLNGYYFVVFFACL